ncbi:hypothetical protein [Brevibacillus fulvus]|uniref:Uncharacterized protein n=1 Tax=Brevibacillus fulvus TaxID=1125967 RepID=A0A938Y4G4_9BACL|nr:hypothetical protein [Brevibacillus fulvus]MBM7591055.1 hypothetical protein [Brevibacillus fulvus]
MHIYALFGTSGTGKSSSALKLAHQLQVDTIIDDGILIYRGQKAAGSSAKYEKTKIQAVKRAIFHYQDHAEEVRQVLWQLSPERLLILGTSQRMIHRIIDALRLPAANLTFIPIEDVKSLSEIEAAKYIRETQGKHVIPIPRIEVERDFFQRIIASAQQIFSAKKEIIGETTIVRPTFFGGRIQLNEQVLKKLVQITCQRFPEVGPQLKTSYTFDDLPRLTISLSLNMAYLQPVLPLLSRIQQAVFAEISYSLEIAPASIDLYVSAISLHKKDQA